MHTLHRYVFKSVFLTWAVAVGLFAFVIVMVNAVKDLMPYLLAGQLTAGELTQLVLLLFPFVASYALPAGLLTGVLLVLGRMSAQQEITAARAAGLSFGYIVRPVWILGVLGMLLTLAVNYTYLPKARVAYHELLAETLRTKPLAILVPKTFIRDFPDYVIYVGDNGGGVLRDCWVWHLDEQKRVVQFVRSESGHIDYDATEGRALLTLTKATVEVRDAANPEDFSKPQPLGSGEQWGPVELKNFFHTQIFNKKQAWLTWQELLAERTRLLALPASPENDRAIMQVQITLSEKGALALAALSLTLLAVPLGIKISRKETTANLAVALLCALGYYFLTTMTGLLNNKPALRPDLLLWLPNVILLLVAGLLYWRLERR